MFYDFISKTLQSQIIFLNLGSNFPNRNAYFEQSLQKERFFIFFSLFIVVSVCNFVHPLALGLMPVKGFRVLHSLSLAKRGILCNFIDSHLRINDLCMTFTFFLYLFTLDQSSLYVDYILFILVRDYSLRLSSLYFTDLALFYNYNYHV